MILNADDSRLSWQGVISLEKSVDGLKPWRLPHPERDFYDPGLQQRAVQNSGVRLRFATNSSIIVLHGKINQADYGPPKFDLIVDNKIIATATVDATGEKVVFADLEQHDRVVEVWFPANAGFTLRAVELSDDATIAAAEDSRPRWLVHGSSITHCYLADSPGLTWPARVARKMGLNLTNLGYMGECKIDPMVARLIRDTPADIITLKLGINTHNGNFIARTFSAAIVGTIAIVREKHPDIPLVICSPIWSPPRETAGAGVTLVQMREIIATAVETFQRHGDRHIYYVDGLKLFGPEHHSMLPDELHPNTAGMAVIAENFINEVFVKHGVKPKNNTGTRSQ